MCISQGFELDHVSASLLRFIIIIKSRVRMIGQERVKNDDKLLSMTGEIL